MGNNLRSSVGNSKIKKVRTKLNWTLVSLAITIFMLFQIRYPSLNPPIPENLQIWFFILIYAAPIPLIPLLYSLTKWWLGEKVYLSIIRVLEDMEAERRDTPSHEYNPIFYTGGMVEEGIEYNHIGWLNYRRPENEPTPSARQRRAGRFSNEQVKMLVDSRTFLYDGTQTMLQPSEIPHDHSYTNKIFYIGENYIATEGGYWECLPSLSEIRRIKYRFKVARLYDEDHRYVKS